MHCADIDWMSDLVLLDDIVEHVLNGAWFGIDVVENVNKPR